MQFIAHRINTIEALKAVPAEYGVELDVRDKNDRLILQHDPFKDGEDFAAYLKHYHHGTMILNIKSERIEHRVLELIKQYNVCDYFFLDSSFPMITVLAKEGEHNIALRFSEYEGMDTILAMKGKARWVWVDCFTQLPLNPENYQILKTADFQLCLVSPELQEREKDIEMYRQYLMHHDLMCDAVCAKIYNSTRWLGV